MHATNRVPVPFNGMDYLLTGTYFDLLRGMEEALRRWDEIDPVRALELVAYFHEGLDAQERHRVAVFTPSSPQNLEAEHIATILAAVDIIKRADASGYDARGTIAQFRPHMRREVESSIPRLTRAQQPPSFLRRVFGR